MWRDVITLPELCHLWQRENIWASELPQRTKQNIQCAMASNSYHSRCQSWSRSCINSLRYSGYCSWVFFYICLKCWQKQSNWSMCATCRSSHYHCCCIWHWICKVRLWVRVVETKALQGRLFAMHSIPRMLLSCRPHSFNFQVGF